MIDDDGDRADRRGGRDRPGPHSPRPGARAHDRPRGHHAATGAGARPLPAAARRSGRCASRDLTAPARASVVDCAALAAACPGHYTLASAQAEAPSSLRAAATAADLAPGAARGRHLRPAPAVARRPRLLPVGGPAARTASTCCAPSSRPGTSRPWSAARIRDVPHLRLRRHTVAGDGVHRHPASTSTSHLRRDDRHGQASTIVGHTGGTTTDVVPGSRDAGHAPDALGDVALGHRRHRDRAARCRAQRGHPRSSSIKASTKANGQPSDHPRPCPRQDGDTGGDELGTCDPGGEPPAGGNTPATATTIQPGHLLLRSHRLLQPRRGSRRSRRRRGSRTSTTTASPRRRRARGSSSPSTRSTWTPTSGCSGSTPRHPAARVARRAVAPPTDPLERGRARSSTTSDAASATPEARPHRPATRPSTPRRTRATGRRRSTHPRRRLLPRAGDRLRRVAEALQPALHGRGRRGARDGAARPWPTPATRPRPACPNPTADLPAGTNALFLVDRTRFASTYGAAGTSARRRARRVRRAAPRRRQGAVVELDDYPDYVAAREAADANPCSVDAVNEVVAADRRRS